MDKIGKMAFCYFDGFSVGCNEIIFGMFACIANTAILLLQNFCGMLMLSVNKQDVKKSATANSWL